SFLCFLFLLFFFFFFQAEDGIRDLTVTGVQTCALPIYRPDGRVLPGRQAGPNPLDPRRRAARRGQPAAAAQAGRRARRRRRGDRSEERRVGKEWRARWAREQ